MPMTRLRLALACATVALLALPAGAGAKAQPEVKPGRFQLHVPLPSNDGWRMRLEASNHRQISLTASRGAMSVEYRVVGRASSRRLRADFGSLGRVDIRLDLEAEPTLSFSPKDKRDERRCRGKDPVELSGRFHGIVDFDGEARVAGTFDRRGRASVERRFRRVCAPAEKPPQEGKAEGREPRFEFSLLGARAHSGGRTTAFDAFAAEIFPGFLFGAFIGGVHERLGRVKISRNAFELFEGPALTTGPSGGKDESAKVRRPPAPFTGRASYSKKAGGPADWTGTLAVRLPGAGNVPLAGPEFKAMLCRSDDLDTLIEDVKGCFLESRALGGFYGSGSHSQPLALARLSSLR
jgi:hypothetical protein